MDKEIKEKIDDLEQKINGLKENIGVMNEVIDSLKARLERIETNGLGQSVTELRQTQENQNFKLKRLERKQNGYGL